MARFGDIHADPIPSSEIPASNVGTPKGYVTIQDITDKAAEAAPVKSVNGKQDIVVITKDDVGLGNVDNTSDANKPISNATQSALNNKSPLLNDTGTGNSIIANPNNASVKKIAAGDGVSITSNTTTIIISSTGGGGGGDSIWGNITGTLSNQVDLQEALNEKASQATVSSHIGNSSNPHNVTKSQVGLGSVDNTSDVNKPISNAAQAALNTKADTSAVNAHTSNTSNPHGVTKTQVGLGNVDNTSDVNKPISTATQVALNAKAASLNDSGSGSSQIVNGGAGTIKKLEAGANVTITDNGDRLTISSTGGGGGGSVDWGAIGGTLSSQSDLWSALSGKSPVLNDSGGGYSIVSNSGTGEIKKLTAGTNVSISDSGASLVISALSGGGGSGTVTSVGLTAPTMMQVSGSPVTTSGNIELSWISGQQPYTKTEVDTLLSKKPGVVVCTRAEWEAAMQAPYPLTIYVGCDITFDTNDLSYGLVTDEGNVHPRDPKYDKNIIGINGKPTITVIGNGMGAAGQVISFRSAINLLVKNIRFVSSENNGFIIQNYQRVSNSLNKTIIIEDCIFENCYKPIIMSGAITSYRSGKWIIRGNKFINCGASDEGYPAVIAMQGNLSDINISDNTFINSVWNAMHIYHKNNVGYPRAGLILIKGNLIDGYGRDGIEVFSSGNSITTENMVRNWFAPTSTPAGTSGIAISITGTYPSSVAADTNFVVSNNIIENFRYYGIELIAMIGCTCIGNIVKKSFHILPMGFDPKGICVSDCYGSVISGNYIEDVDYTYSNQSDRNSTFLWSASGIQVWAHDPATPGTENLITANTIRNCSKGIHLNNVAEQFVTNNLICFSTESYNHKTAIWIDNNTSGHVCRSNIAKNTMGTSSGLIFRINGTSTIFTDDLGTQVTGPGTFSGGSNLIVS